MNCTRCIVLLASIVTITLCCAQGFNIAHHNLNLLPAQGRSVFEHQDGFLAFNVQFAWDSSASILFTSMFDGEGNFLWETPHPNPQSMDPGIMDPVTPLLQGGYATGITLFGNGQPNRTYLYRFDENGDTLWTRFLKEDTTLGINSGTRHLLQLPDEGFLHSGWCSVTGGAACIMRLDSSGTILWERIYPPCTYIFNSSPTFDGGFVLGSKINSYPDQGVVIKVDSLGEQIWLERFGGRAITVGKPTALPDGSILTTGAWEELNASPSSEFQYGSVYRYTDNGVQVWRRDYFYGWKASTTMIRPSADGNFWVIGGRHSDDYTLNFMHLLKIDLNGDSLWMRNYWYYDSYVAANAIYGATPTSDGGLVMTGLAKQGENDPQPFLASMWLLRVDEHGCVVPGCHTVGVNEYAADLNQYFNLWPNPVQAGDPISFSFDPPAGFTPTGDLRAVLLDTGGREVHSQQFATGTSLFTIMPAVAPGTYHLHLTDERSWLAGAKVVIE